MIYGTGLCLEEKKFSLLQPDPSVPFQYFQIYQSRNQLEPEKRLMLAVLEDAIVCMKKYFLERKTKERRWFRDAQEWVLEEDCDWPFSFENICFHLGINPNYLREGLIRSKTKSPTRSLQPRHRLAHEKLKAGRKRKPSKVAA